MSFELDNLIGDRALPSDVTPRAPIYRRQGVLASLLARLAYWGADRQLRRASRRYLDGSAPAIPDYLREDLGLAPLPPRLPGWWEIKW